MNLYEIVKENGASVFQEATKFAELEKSFLNKYRFDNYTEAIEVYIVDPVTLKRRRRVKKYEKVGNQEIFLKSLTQKKYPYPNIRVEPEYWNLGPDSNIRDAKSEDILEFLLKFFGNLMEE